MIEKIRRQSWLLLILVGFGILSFLIPYDAVMALFGGSNTTIGKIDGTTISASQWQTAKGIRSQLFEYNGNESNISNDTWNQMQDSILFSDEYAQCGLDITEEEYDAILFGDKLSPFVLQTIYGGKDSTEMKDQMRTNFESLEPSKAQGWKNLIIATRKREKYDAMIKKGPFANTLDGKWSFKQENDKASLDYVVKTYAEIPDSTITWTDSDLRSYYNKHKNDREYKQEESRNLEYIKFPVPASSADSAEIRASLEELMIGLKTSTTDSIYAASKAETASQAYIKAKKGSLPEPFDTQVTTDSIGKVVGPYVQGNFYKIAKIVSRGSEMDSVQAKHILIAYKGATRAGATVTRSKEEAKTLANTLFAELKAKNNFKEINDKYSDDATSKTKDGDLGMFGRGGMTKKFEDACFNGKLGEQKMVETEFGFHLIEITKLGPSNPFTRLAVIDKKIVPSQLTIKSGYQLARDFCQNYTDTAAFRHAADTLMGGTSIAKAYNVKPNATSIQGLGNSGAVVSWAYGAEEGEVSQPIMIDDNYIIAALVEIKEKGVPTFENIKDKVKDKVIKEKKAEYYIKLMKEGDLAAIASACSTSVKHADNITLKSTNIPGSGVSLNENKLIGAIFGIPTGNISEPIVGEGGIYVIQRTTDISLGTSTDNYQSQLESIASGYRSRASNDVMRAYKEKADIIDNRYKRR